MQIEALSYTTIHPTSEQWILKDAFMQINKGEVGFLLGRNGSGKTTLLNLIAGVLTPTSGKIHRGQSFFYLPASPYLDGHLLVKDVYDILKCDSSLTDENACLFETQHLTFQRISKISSGEYKRVWLVATLSQKCQLFLLDEPLSHLDWPFQQTLQKIILDMSGQGHCFLITTHNFNWTLGLQKAFAWIFPPPFQKQLIKKALKSEIFQKTFECISEITDNPLNGDPILALSSSNMKK